MSLVCGAIWYKFCFKVTALDGCQVTAAMALAFAIFLAMANALMAVRRHFVWLVAPILLIAPLPVPFCSSLPPPLSSFSSLSYSPHAVLAR